MTTKELRIGLVGAGFISGYHIAAIRRQANATLIAICDLDAQTAERAAAETAGARAYSDLDLMLKEENIDVVHVLTQPDSHLVLAKRVIEFGCDVILEKPATASHRETVELQEFAQARGMTVAVNHNFVCSRPFKKLQQALRDDRLGPLKSVRVVWKNRLRPVESGPWDLWMLRSARNILFETGSHSISELLAICKDPIVTSVSTRRHKALPSGAHFVRQWAIRARAGETDIQMDFSFDLGFEQHFVEVEGMFGVARADIENDVFTIESSTGRAYDSERLHVNLGQGITRSIQALRTFSNYAGSKLFQRALGNPYNTSMKLGIASCYEQVRKLPAACRESTLAFAIEVASFAESIQQYLKPEVVGEASKVDRTGSKIAKAPYTLIIGASGFIGKRLLQCMLDKGESVRALVRNPTNLADIELGDCGEIIVGDYRDDQLMDRALEGVAVVVHLAVAHSNSLAGYVKGALNPTKRLIDKCRAVGVQRFVYTGTIDSLYLGPGSGAVTEADGVDHRIKRRNNYARSKAMAESYLFEQYTDHGFPAVVLRPAIVLGLGGPVDHAGVAEWFGIGRCRYWGNGRNHLPLVLVDDVVAALYAAMHAPGIEGRSYNLSAESSVSARDYVSEIESVIGCKIRADASSTVWRFLGDAVKWAVKVVARHPDRQRIPSARDWRCREQQAQFDCSAAKSDLGWQPVNDRDTIIEKGVRLPAQAFLQG